MTDRRIVDALCWAIIAAGVIAYIALVFAPAPPVKLEPVPYWQPDTTHYFGG